MGRHKIRIPGQKQKEGLRVPARRVLIPHL